MIHPISADYVQQGIAHANKIHARAVILRINTPGGLPDSVQRIAASIQNSSVPVTFSPVGLKLADARIEPYAMTLRQRLLSRALNPNIALIVGVLGLFAVCFELTHPGWILPGLGGAFCLILSLYSFSLLPVRGAGVLLMLLAVVLFVLEAVAHSRGISALAGIVLMIAGGSILVHAPIPELRIYFATTVAVTLAVAAIIIFHVRLAVASRRIKSNTGAEDLVGLDYLAETRGKK